ncbi:MAG: aminotransferase class I/II-fold pyridoxal phosphate-dependent enzyme, partial [Fimbriimonadaceae bacterium]|nr:aminotransferase class I/II-fold pyridoxal phosphate-dependent enzyme [Chitinophagales bacterium]
MIVDLRSDTFTKPTQAMREFMLQAEVGDDVFGEDVTVNALEEKIKNILGAEAAVYCPTATMCNQIAIKLLTRPMDEIICDRTAHIYNYEVGGMAFHSGCIPRYVFGKRGVFTAQDVIDNINPEDVHKTITRLIVIENTSNRGGGKIFPLQTIKEIRTACNENKLKLHLDGSRLFNALVETRDDKTVYGKIFDTITICLSKGLGCPAGALLICQKENELEARRIRKAFGGGMRQAGILAAAGIYALDNNVERLKEDHAHAKQIETTLQHCKYLNEILPVETNIVIFQLKQNVKDYSFIHYLSENNIKAFAIGENWI